MYKNSRVLFEKTKMVAAFGITESDDTVKRLIPNLRNVASFEVNNFLMAALRESPV